MDIITIMNVDLLSIINNTEQEIKISGETSFSDNGCDALCSVFGSADNRTGRVCVKLHIDAVVKTLCSRCLKSVEQEYSADTCEFVGEDGVLPNGTVLDIDNIVKNNIVPLLPISFLCSDDCKGLCGICGADLNISQCDCSHDVIDERFDVLRKLLEESSKSDKTE